MKSLGELMPHCILLSDIAKLRKFISCRLLPQIGAKFLFMSALIISGILGVCLTDANGEERSVGGSFVEEVDIYRNRNPFALPSGVKFEEKAETDTFSDYTEWKDGMVASVVNGIFQSGDIARANVNGIWVEEGDWLGEEQVLEIGTGHVVLIGNENAKRTLPLRSFGSETELKIVARVR